MRSDELVPIKQAAADLSRRPPSPAHPLQQPLPWLLVQVLAGLFVLVWLSPQLEFLKLSESVMPVAVHALLEMAAVVIAILSFAVAWHAYEDARAANVLILGCGLLSVGLVDVAHLLSYKGMPDLVTAASPEKSINFWLCARLLAAITLLLVAAREWAPLPARPARLLLLAVALAAALAIWIVELAFPQLWPRTFIEGQGLTRFKVAAEYTIIGLLLVPAILFYRQRGSQHRPYDTGALFAASVISILSELCFTMYTNVNEVFSLLGHAYKVVAYVYIYRAVFVVSVRQPYQRLQEEIGERHRAEEEILHRVYHDPVTGLPNRLMLEEQLQDCLSCGERLALLSIDVDYFKSVNDALGIAAGDELLRQVGERLQRACGERALLTRSAGDSFVVLARGAASESDVQALLNQLMARMRAPCRAAGLDFALTVSAGIALAPRDGRDFDSLKRNADIAMARAKQDGRDTSRFFDPEMDDRARERRRMLGWLREAIDQQQFVLYYQPQVCLANGQVTGFEALLRWQNPQLGLVMPDRFIGVAEDTGLIGEIGDGVLREACLQMAQWRSQGYAGLSMAVNVSAVQFRKRQLEKSVAAALATARLPASQLELEMTESALLHEHEGVLATARALHAMGVRLAIDDFGTGYSSLSYLKRFAVSRLKIDRSFISDLTHDADNASIVQAVIQMAHNLHLVTVAEGVEDEETQAALIRLGAEEAQGYLYGRPMPAEQASAFLAERMAAQEPPAAA